jgi:adenylate cyclase
MQELQRDHYEVPAAEANTAEDAVRLNALFEIVVPAVVDAGGHVNKFLGDGALAVFGAPDRHRDQHRSGDGTIGGGGKLESVDALVPRPPGLTDRGFHAVKGKSAAIKVFGLNPGAPSSSMPDANRVSGIEHP